MTDNEIIDLYFERNDEAIVQTQGKYGDYCFAIGNNILSNKEDSEECVNETWLKAWNSIPPKRPNKLSSFLGRITRNLAFDRYRALHSAKRGKGNILAVIEELDECIPDKNDTESHIENNELKIILDNFLESLSHKDRVIFLERYWFAKSFLDISWEKKINPNTVKASLFRSRKKLKACLEKEGIKV